MASVHQKVGMSPYWMMKFRDEAGRVVMRSSKETNRKEAQKKADDFEAAAKKARAGELTQAVCVKILSEMMERSIQEKFEPEQISKFFRGWVDQRTGSTAKRYRPVIEGFIKSLGEIRAKASLASITVKEIEKFRDSEVASGKGATTANFAVSTIRSVLNQARRKQHILSNPAEAVDLLPGEPEKREPFTDDDITTLLKAAGESEWRGMIFFGLHCGFRLHDAANIEWQHLDLEAGTVAFEQEKTSFVKVAMHAELLRYVGRLKHGAGAAPLFPSLYGIPSGSAGGLSNAFSRLMQRAGVQVRLGAKKEGKGRRFRSKGFHSFRHTFISRLTNADVSPDVRKKMAGHTDDEVHERYSHLAIETQRRAVAKLTWAENPAPSAW